MSNNLKYHSLDMYGEYDSKCNSCQKRFTGVWTDILIRNVIQACGPIY